MPKKLSIMILSVFMLLSVSGAYALGINYKQTQANDGLPGEYLTNFGVNARALAMGNAYTALANDASAPYWNPAGLGQLSWQEATFLYANLYSGTSLSYLSYAQPFLERNVLGISWVSLGTGDIEKTDVFGDVLGNFSDKENAYYISYARKISEKFDAGANLKIITQDIDTYSAFGYGLDLAGMYYPSKILTVGATLQNVLSPRLKLKDEPDDFPMNLKLGTAVKLLDQKLIYDLDLDYLNLMPKKSLYESGTGKSLLKWHTGLEYNYPVKLATLAVRAGVDYQEITAGFGVSTRYFDFNYAIGLNDLETTHRFSINARFGLLPNQEEKELARLRLENEVAAHYQLALKAFNEKDYEQATGESRQVLKLAPENKEAQNILDSIAMYKRKQEALVYFNKALDFYRDNDAKNADLAMKKAEELDPVIKKNQEDEHFNQAKEMMATRQYKEAELELTKTLLINPDNTAAREQLKKLKDIMQFLQ